MCDIVKVCHAAVLMEAKAQFIVSVNVRSDWSSSFNPNGVYIAVHCGTSL